MHILPLKFIMDSSHPKQKVEDTRLDMNTHLSNSKKILITLFSFKKNLEHFKLKFRHLKYEIESSTCRKWNISSKSIGVTGLHFAQSLL